MQTKPKPSISANYGGAVSEQESLAVARGETAVVSEQESRAVGTTDTVNPGARSTLKPATTKQELFALLKKNPGIEKALLQKALPGFEKTDMEDARVRHIEPLANGNFEVGFEKFCPLEFGVSADPELYVVEATAIGAFVQNLREPEPPPAPVITPSTGAAKPAKVDLSKHTMRAAERTLANTLVQNEEFMSEAFSNAMASMSDRVSGVVLRARADGNFDLQIKVSSIFSAGMDERLSFPCVIDKNGTFLD